MAVQTAPHKPWKRMAFALAVATAVVAGGLLVWNGSPSGEADVALVDAVQRQTGLLLSARDASLDPTSGVWRAEQLELRTTKDGAPVLSARSVSLRLRTADLLRGDVTIERAAFEGAVLTLDLRDRPAGGQATPIDRKRLTQWLPAEVKAQDTTLVVRSETRDVEIAGLVLTLKRQGDALEGNLAGQASRASSRSLGQTDPAPALPVTLSSKLKWSAQGLTMDELTVGLNMSTLRGSARVDDSARLELGGDNISIADLEPFLSRELRGRGRLELQAHGGEQPLVVTAKLDLQNAAVGDFAMDHLKANVAFEGEATTVRELSVERGAERYRSDALVLDAADVPTGTLKVEDVSIAEALKRVGFMLTAAGRATGSVELSKDEAVVQLSLTEPSIGAYRFDTGTLAASFAPRAAGASAFDIQQLQLSSKLASLSVSGKADSDGRIALEGRARTALGGRDLDIDITVRGTAETPQTTLQLAGLEAARAGYALHAELSGTQLVRGNLELKNADFSQHLPAIENAGAPFGRIDARIELTRGALDDLRAFEGQGEITKLSFGYGDTSFESAARFPIALRDGRVQLRDVALKTGSARWTLQGELDVERGVDLSATAELPVAPLVASAPFIEGAEGTARVALTLKGKEGSLALSGQAEPHELTLAVGPLHTAWTQIKGRVSLEAGALHFHDVTGSFGSGSLTLSGALALAGVKPKSADLKLALRDFAFSPEQRFDIALEADSTLKWRTGDALPVLGGNVTLTRMHYGRHVQLPEAVIALGRKSKSAGEPTVALDLLVSNSAPLSVRNDFLDVELEIAGKDHVIHVLGTDARVGAIGELSVLRGRALFRGATLTVRHGVITFKSEKNIVPALDLQADAPAKRRPGGTIHFSAKGDPTRFDLELHCEANGPVPDPYACAYAGDEMVCGNFAELTALWACQAP